MIRYRKQLDFYYKFQEKIGWVLNTPWTYENENIDALWSQMSEVDKALLPFDVRACDWPKYYTNMFAKQFGPFAFPEFEHLTEEKRAELREKFFYKHYLNY